MKRPAGPFPPRRYLAAINVALLRLPPLDLAGTKNDLTGLLHFRLCSHPVDLRNFIMYGVTGCTKKIFYTAIYTGKEDAARWVF